MDRDRPFRLITAGPVDRLARTVEALLVVASQPLSVDELAAAADDDPARVETALGLLGERFAEERSGIVLEHVAGGWAFRASREAAEACGRLFERPVERGLIAESGREEGVGGAVRYRTTPLFERVFGLESLSQLPRLDDVGEEAVQIRERLEAVAERRGA